MYIETETSEDLGLYNILSMALFICILYMIAISNFVAIKPKMMLYINISDYIWTAFSHFIIFSLFMSQYFCSQCQQYEINLESFFLLHVVILPLKQESDAFY